MTTDPNLITQLIGSYGFPVAVTAFLLIKGSKVISDLTAAITDMKIAIQQLKDSKGGQ